jgi:hypothetical protein
MKLRNSPAHRQKQLRAAMISIRPQRTAHVLGVLHSDAAV